MCPARLNSGIEPPLKRHQTVSYTRRTQQEYSTSRGVSYVAIRARDPVVCTGLFVVCSLQDLVALHQPTCHPVPGSFTAWRHDGRLRTL